MYLHELQAALEGGKKVRRLAWDKDQHLVMLQDSIALELDPDDQKDIGIEKDAELEVVAGTLALCEGKKSASIGYQLTHEDKTSQDWELV